MRIDHHAYQRATRVAGVGFLVQLVTGLTLLLFALVGNPDTPILFGSVFILLGLLAWLGLLVIFNQHKLERLESLEEDQLAATRGETRDASSVFAQADEEIRVAARRLRLMHKWFLPGISVAIAVALSFLAWMMLRHMSAVSEQAVEWRLTPYTGWAVAICLGFSAVSFIVSRFIAGMAKLPAWQNLRAGAAFMVGNSLVTLALAVGTGFRFFDNEQAIKAIAYSIPIFMLVVAAEIVLNLILNLYRPRLADETPRPAFDSKLLSLLSAPDNLVRSINEAVNYQFGFDITSSWGYQLLLRSTLWLLGLGVAVFVLLNMLVIVEPHEQAVKLSRGKLVNNEVHRSGVLWKLPWPLQSAEVYPVTTIRRLHVTSKQVTRSEIQLWTDNLGQEFDKPLDPFLVGSSKLQSNEFTPDPGGDPSAAAALSEQFSLVDAEIIVEYRIKEDGGLLDYLAFATDERPHRSPLTERELAMRAIAERVISGEMTRLSIDQVLADRRLEIGGRFRQLVQQAFDDNRTGVDIVSINLPFLRPAGEAAPGFEELSISAQARRQYVASEQATVVAGLAQLVGDPDRAQGIVTEIEAWEALRDEHGAGSPEVLAKAVEIERQLLTTSGEAAARIAQAERDRWVGLMGARAESSRVRGQVISYRAAPNLYREREIMRVYANAMSGQYKYVICGDPSQVSFKFDLRELTSGFNFADALDELTENDGGSAQ